MGSRPCNAQSDRPSLTQDDSRDFAELAANFLGERLACLSVGLASFLPLKQKSFNPGGRCSDHPRRASLEQILPRSACAVPCGGDDFIVGKVRLRAVGERLDQPKRVANARKARHGLRIS